MALSVAQLSKLVWCRDNSSEVFERAMTFRADGQQSAHRSALPTLRANMALEPLLAAGRQVRLNAVLGVAGVSREDGMRA